MISFAKVLRVLLVRHRSLTGLRDSYPSLTFTTSLLAGATIHTQNGLSLSFKKRQTFSELSHKVKIIAAAATSIPSPLPSMLETTPTPLHCVAKFTVQAHDKIEPQIPQGLAPLEGKTESKSKCPMSGM